MSKESPVSSVIEEGARAADKIAPSFEPLLTSKWFEVLKVGLQATYLEGYTAGFRAAMRPEPKGETNE